jgi:eukaryotic-like serine/threonine-protein kinase
MMPAGSAQDSLLGRVLADRFEILQRIGEGGMGVVYKARQISVDRIVAIKVLNATVAQDPQWVQRFNNEARACSKLQHPNTVRLIDFGPTREGLLFMAMEYLDGMSLRAAIDRGGRMRPDRVLRILIQCCQSLAEAHGIGIIHRDIKPDNLYLMSMGGQQDFVKVLDFSVAKLKQQAGSAMQTQAGVVFGTPNYMSPEQGRGLPLDARSDIYALGIVAFEMLMGRAPFTSQNPMEVLAMHVRAPVPPMPGVPDRVAKIVMRSLAKEASQRQQTVQELEAECGQALAELGGIPGMVGVGISGSVPVQQAGISSPMAPPPVVRPQAAAPQAKTLFADAAQVAIPRAQGMAAGASGPGPAPAGDSAAKTMIAPGAGPAAGVGMGMPMPAQMGVGAAPGAGAMPNGPQHGGPLGAQPGRPGMLAQPMGSQPLPPQQAPVHTPTPGDPKTVLLQNSEGIISFAQRGRPVPVGARPVVDAGRGSSAGFWALCIFIGIAVGVLAYLVVSRVVT